MLTMRVGRSARGGQKKRRVARKTARRRIAFTSWLDYLPWRGWVYLIESSGGGYKIGVTKDCRARLDCIDKSLEGSKETILHREKLFFYGFYERALHRVYNRDRFYKGGSGGSEWFWLNMFERMGLIFRMRNYYFSQLLVIYTAAAVLFWKITGVNILLYALKIIVWLLAKGLELLN